MTADNQGFQLGLSNEEGTDSTQWGYLQYNVLIIGSDFPGTVRKSLHITKSVPMIQTLSKWSASAVQEKEC